VLVANVGKILGGIEAFPEARPDDGRLELGLVTAGNTAQWARTFARLARGQATVSPSVKVTQGRSSGSGSARRSATSSTAAPPASKKLRIR
jgi:diacylglycerol kinase (ATP)